MRRWVSFNERVTTKEFRDIPQPDRGALFAAMALYRREEAKGYVLKDYGDGLLMLKPPNRTSGRCLFFTVDEADATKLVALLAYKKESDDAPAHLIAAARERRQRYCESEKHKRKTDE